MGYASAKRRARASLALAVAAASQASALYAADDSALEEVYVLGRGETRQVQTIVADQIDRLPAGTSPLKALEKMPGVNFQSADPFGAYEWSARITIRGFNQNQLGFTLDGIPLGDMSYANHNGLHISRAISSENVGSVRLAQGTGGLGTASSSNLGGTVEFFSAEPGEEMAASVNLTGGSEDTQRAFLRMDSGDLGTGTRVYASYTDQSAEKWRGEGDQEQEQFNIRLAQSIGSAELSAYYAWSDRQEIDYQDVSLEMIDRLGNRWDNYYPNWRRAVNAAQGNFTGAVTSLDDAYWNAAGLREDDLGYIGLDLPLGADINWNNKVYMHQNEGQGLWGTPYVGTPGGAPLTVRTTEYEVDRSGWISALTWNLGDHELNAGLWYETNDFNQARRFYGEPDIAGPTRDFREFQRNPLLTQWEYDFDTETWQFHVQDTWQLSDAVRLNFGFKSLSVETDNSTVTGADLSGSIESEKNFLPQIGVVYSLSDTQELFAGVAQNMRAFIGAATGASPFATTPEGFAAIKDNIDPETSTTWEMGWRFAEGSLEGTIAAYYVDFEDRLLAIRQGSGIQGNPSVLANVGSVETMGLEAALIWNATERVTWFNSMSLNSSEFADDFENNGVEVPVQGKDVPDAPREMFRSELGYDDGSLFLRADMSFTGKRYYTYLNEGQVDSYTLFNLGAGYRFAGLQFVEELVAQLDVTNLFDEDYISTVGSNGFVNSDPNGTEQTLLIGAPRMVFMSLKARF
jgi:iron complex outermembrane recepter protein